MTRNVNKYDTKSIQTVRTLIDEQTLPHRLAPWLLYLRAGVAALQLQVLLREQVSYNSSFINSAYQSVRGARAMKAVVPSLDHPRVPIYRARKCRQGRGSES